MSQQSNFDAELRELSHSVNSESIPYYYVPNRAKPIQRSNKVQCIFVFGIRGGGKSVNIEQYAEWYYNEGITPLYLWAANSNENVFVCVNQNCRDKWHKRLVKLVEMRKQTDDPDQRKKIEKVIVDIKNNLHCNCHKSYPVSWLVPEMWKFSGIEEYNKNQCWASKEQYISALKKGIIFKQYNELTLIEREQLDNGKLVKPRYLIKSDLLRICPFTIPKKTKSGSTLEIFEQQFVKYLLDARKERRWLIMNPMMFQNEEDRYNTISYIISRLPVWLETYFQPLTPEQVGKMRGLDHPVPMSQWNNHELHWHQALLCFTELRSIAPTNRYSSYVKSSMSKRSLVAISAELRHKNLFLIGDLQNAEDLNEQIKPLSDFVIIKNATLQLLGKEYYPLVMAIEKKRKDLLLKITHGKYLDFTKAPVQYKHYIDSILPRIQELPINKAYVVWPNNEYKLITIKGTSWHHKQEGESLQSITNINWKIRKDFKPSTIDEKTEQQEAKTIEKVNKKEDTNKVLRWCVEEFVRVGKWKLVVDNLKVKVESGDLPDTPVSKLDERTISNKVRKDEKCVLNLETAKNMKDRSPKEIIDSMKW